MILGMWLRAGRRHKQLSSVVGAENTELSMRIGTLGTAHTTGESQAALHDCKMRSKTNDEIYDRTHVTTRISDHIWRFCHDALISYSAWY